ncbi:MAG: ATP-binding protein [Gammaproteobacteria bacterium]|nr:ATP-binding protein [Gammaproteobacteria bacterium]
MMKNRLIWKLLAVNIPIVVIVITLIWLSVDYLAADYFMVLMDKYHISPTETHAMFLSAVHRYLIKASLIAIVIAVIVGFLMNKKILDPLSQMIKVTEKIANGDYSTRVKIKSSDEISQLGEAFNRMADSLQKIEALRKNMVIDVAHELRTPLTNVRGYLEALSDGVVKPEKETYDLLLQEAGRLTELVEDLNKLTKADMAELNVKKEPLILPEIIEKTVSFYKPLISDKKIDISLHFSPKADTIVADKNQLHQVLNNLMQNACRYTPDGGKIEIKTTSEIHGIQVTVTNTGTPIPQEALPLIFERFYRVDKSRSRDSGGAGIGLAIVKKLISAHGGEVGAESGDNKNHVWFRLPV